jgi:hypothetical protein
LTGRRRRPERRRGGGGRRNRLRLDPPLEFLAQTLDDMGGASAAPWARRQASKGEQAVSCLLQTVGKPVQFSCRLRRFEREVEIEDGAPLGVADICAAIGSDQVAGEWSQAGGDVRVFARVKPQRILYGATSRPALTRVPGAGASNGSLANCRRRN